MKKGGALAAKGECTLNKRAAALARSFALKLHVEKVVLFVVEHF